MTTPIRILTATNGSSFSEREIIIVGLTDEGTSQALRVRLTNQWNAKEMKDREFWHDDFEAYFASWDINTIGGSLES